MSSIPYLILFALALPVYAAQWSPLTEAGKPECSSSRPCRVSNGEDTFEIKLRIEDRGKRKSLKGIEFKNIKNGNKQEFALEGVNNILAKEAYGILATNFRDNKTKDVVVHAFNSAREGEVYFYFLYNPSAHNFVMSEGTIPKLQRVAKTEIFRTELQESEYLLGQDLKLTEK